MQDSTSIRCVRSGGNRGVAAALLMIVACGSPANTAEPEQRSLDIIGGYRASSPVLNHTGALVMVGSDGSTALVCTATLIGPETVVTARHCVGFLPSVEQGGTGVAWAAGPDALAPLEVISIASIETAPGDVGGYIGMGRDVAVVHLEHPTKIPPAVPRPFDAEFLGRAMVMLGYGVHGAGLFADETRHIGRETVAAVDGRVYEHLLGSLENFVEWVATGQKTDADHLSTTAVDEEELRLMRVAFDKALLFEGHEAVVGQAPSDTQPCFGDSGGPLGIMAAGGVFETYGVVSGGLPSLRSVCDYGGVFSMFGPVSFAFLERELDWVDPCGEETPVGRCDGDVARRCESNLAAHIRRIESEDCAAQGLACVSSEVGVGCGSVPEPERRPLGEADLEAVSRSVRDASRPELVRGVPWAAGSVD